MAHLTVLRGYADRTDPATLPATIRLCHSDFSVTVFDKYPKSIFHFLLLPLIRPPYTAQDLRDLRTVLQLPREQAKALLQNMRRDALVAKALIEEEMLARHSFKWDIQMGFHAVPSLEHIHLHIMSTDFNGGFIKSKKHLNSFHPKVGFFLHIDDVLSWFEPDVAPTWFAMKSDIDRHEYEKLLKEDMMCPHCDKAIKTIPKMKDHLRAAWNDRVKEESNKAARAIAARAMARSKRKHEEQEPAETDGDDAQSHPAKRVETDSSRAVESTQDS
ncbi:hypothetical protein K466DRAFT_582202 [Polyporus arcularius HHB13444]|uniref:Aprataxin C2HE/C2H2/C2HC zinc finger domain-containing protein n=1 Tax=Polyporus arcularius HHB13444 TaxID=1314778 RepID=A0A5C3PQN4_9APHY|nr:hypothetical protein K466DRAFT_582202 [Polyporus arcularius HHB13444]